MVYWLVPALVVLVIMLVFVATRSKVPRYRVRSLRPEGSEGVEGSF